MFELFFVTIILPIYNQESTIAKCIQSLINQTYKNKEIIVVDDGSTDNSLEIASNFPVKVLSFEHQHKPKIVNRAIKEAKGDIIFIGEGDAVYPSDYLKLCLEKFEDEKVTGVIGKQLSIPSDNLISRAIAVYREVQWNLAEDRSYLTSTAWIIRREALEDVGGFDEDLIIADDAAMGIKLSEGGYKIAFEERTEWLHHEKSSIKGFLRKEYVRGKDSYLFLKKYGKARENPHVRSRIKTIVTTTLATIFFLLSLTKIYLTVIFLFTLIFLILIKCIQFVLKARRVTQDLMPAFIFPILNYMGKISFTVGYYAGLLSKFILKGFYKY